MLSVEAENKQVLEQAPALKRSVQMVNENTKQASTLLFAESKLNQAPRQTANENQINLVEELKLKTEKLKYLQAVGRNHLHGVL